MEEQELREALESLVWQFGARSVRGGKRVIWTGGYSALRQAFAALGWRDPYYPPDSPGCDFDGCPFWSEAGTPTPWGYKRLCSNHYIAYVRAEKGEGE